MEQTIEDLIHTLNTYSVRIGAIPENDFSAKQDPKKWSKKEILGHLIDSAHNNLRRFIAGQYESAPRIFYDQDYWVRANNYQVYTQHEIIALWKLVNGQIVLVLKNMPAENYSKECNTSGSASSMHSLQWLAEDYVKHMKHHINQIIPGSFDITYP